jgi:hypothetical protein
VFLALTVMHAMVSQKLNVVQEHFVKMVSLTIVQEAHLVLNSKHPMKLLDVKTALPVVIRLHVVKRRVLNVMQGFSRTKSDKFYLLSVTNVLPQVITVLRGHPLKSSAPLVHIQMNPKRMNARYV